MYCCMRQITFRSTLVRAAAAILVASPLLGIAEHKSLNPNGLSRNDIVFTDSESAVLRANPANSGPELLAQGQQLVRPLGICEGASGELFVSDTGCFGIIGIDTRSGQQRVVAHGPALGMPLGIAAERSGSLLVANGQALVRINPETGEIAHVTSGQYLRMPTAVGVAENGTIYVADALGAIVAVNPNTGVQTFISSGGYLIRPQGIAVRANHLYVTDVATSDGNFGVGRIVHVNLNTKQQNVLSEGHQLVGPVGIAIEPSGNLIVGDPYTINEDSADLFDGAILRVDAATGEQQLLARGKAGFVNPRCVALVRSAGL